MRDCDHGSFGPKKIFSSAWCGFYSGRADETPLVLAEHFRSALFLRSWRALQHSHHLRGSPGGPLPFCRMGGEEKDRSASRTYSGAPTGAEPSSSDSSRGDPRSASRLYVDPGGGSGSSSSRSHHHSSEHGSRRGRRQHQTRVLDSKYVRRLTPHPARPEAE